MASARSVAPAKADRAHLAARHDTTVDLQTFIVGVQVHGRDDDDDDDDKDDQDMDGSVDLHLAASTSASNPQGTSKGLFLQAAADALYLLSFGTTCLMACACAAVGIAAYGDAKSGTGGLLVLVFSAIAAARSAPAAHSPTSLAVQNAMQLTSMNIELRAHAATGSSSASLLVAAAHAPRGMIGAHARASPADTSESSRHASTVATASTSSRSTNSAALHARGRSSDDVDDGS
jgi:hypothetical protein